ncbi:MAG TPA: hypothetical protein VFX35_01155 [Solirubrobacterales bacterium]|nr:hypothetical protein [Solirubrobacterales bacterium]
MAAFVVPGLVLRDTGVLTISRKELAEATPTAAKELERRQEVAADAGRAAPYVGLAFLVVGVGLLGCGVPRLWNQEQSDEERRTMELDKLRAEVRPQSSEERRERLREEVDGGEGATNREALMQEAAHAEEAVLARLATISPPVYELQSQVVVAHADGRLLLDGLLISKIDQLPDIVVEIKYLRRGIVEWERRVREGSRQLQSAVDRYENWAIGWLIIVTAEAFDDARKGKVERTFAESSDGIRLSIVAPEELDQLRLPG